MGDLEPDRFERLCGVIAAEIAAHVGVPGAVDLRVMAASHDGGIEAKAVRPDGRAVGIQAKRYKSFDSECRSVVKDSFATFLTSKAHLDVTHYVWCSGVARTVESIKKSDAALATMREEARKAGRKVEVRFLASGDLDALLISRRPDLLGLLNSGTRMGADDLARYSKRQAEKCLLRLPGQDTQMLDFPSPTAALFDRLAAGAVERRVATAELSDLLDEWGRRSAGVESILQRDVPALRKELEVTLRPRGASTPVSEVLAACDSEAVSSLSELTEVILAKLEENAPGERNRAEVETLLAFAQSCLALRRLLDDVRVEALATQHGQLLVTGAWGTGKTYQLALHARRVQDAGKVVLFLRARDFDRPFESILSQPWRSSLPNADASDEVFLALLDALGVASGAPALLLIDGLNESALRDSDAALCDLVALVERFGNVRLIVTDRRDVDRGEHAIKAHHRHEPPDRAQLSAALRESLGAVPGSEWHAALSNPLLASIASRIIVEHRGRSGSQPLLGKAALLFEWVNVLARELAERTPVVTAPFVRRVADALSLEGGTSTWKALKSRLDCAHQELDVAIEGLLKEGFLERVGAADSDTVRFRWQGAAEMFAVTNAVSRDPDAVDQLLRNGDAGNRSSTLDTLAEVLPTMRPARELPDCGIRNAPSKEVTEAFAWSLAQRDHSNTTERTLALASEALRDDDVSAIVVWCALSAPPGRPLGHRWLVDQLKNSTLVQRASYWPRALEQLLTDDSMIDDVRELFTYFAFEAAPVLSEADALELAELLAWTACCRLRDGVQHVAAQILCELVHRYPAIHGRLLESVGRITDDDHPLEAVMAASLGVVDRWPDEPASRSIRHACMDLLASRAAPVSLGALADLHRLDSSARQSPQPFHAFLSDALAGARTLPRGLPRLAFRSPVFLEEEDVSMFADGKGLREHAALERRILASLGLRGGAVRHAASHEAGETIFGDRGHLGSLVRGRWFAQQYSGYPVGGRLWINGRMVKAGTGENETVEWLSDPASARWEPLDGSVPTAMAVRRDDLVDGATWWAVHPFENAGPELTVTAPDGTAWTVVAGRYRTLSPRGDGTRPVFDVGHHRWMREPKSDGKPSPGRNRHRIVRVETFVSGHTGEEDDRLDSRGRFADVFRFGRRMGELTGYLNGAVGTEIPSRHCLELLGARWTGEGIDCRDERGELVVTDPSCRSDGPRAVLVRTSSLERALESSGQEVHSIVRCEDLNGPAWLGRKWVARLDHRSGTVSWLGEDA